MAYFFGCGRMGKDMKITGDTILAEILKIEGTEEILTKYRVPCVGCAFAEQELDKLKIGDVCGMYGIDSEKLIKELNNINK